MARNSTDNNEAIATLEDEQALVLRCLYDWCYVGRERVMGWERTRLDAVPVYLVGGELDGRIEDLERVLRVLEHKRLIEPEEFWFRPPPGCQHGWKLPGGRTLRVRSERKTEAETGQEIVRTHVLLNGEKVYTETGSDGPPKRAFALTTLGIHEAEKRLQIPMPVDGEGGDEEAPSIHRAARDAYALYEYAVGKEPNLGTATDEEVWRWLHQQDNDELPCTVPENSDTFSRYLRKARQAHGDRKNSPVAGRKCRSGCRPDEL